MTKPFKVHILWGKHDEHEDDDRPVTYSFNTQAELDAFLYGVEEMDGWSQYEVIEDLAAWKADWLDVETNGQ